MWESFKTSTDNNDWTPGKLGAGYIHARTNTPDTFNLLDFSVRTWNVGPDYTDDIDREFRRTRPTDIIIFKFYITPTGGVHDAGKGFQNRTGKSDEAVIAFLHRNNNKLYDSRESGSKTAASDLKSFIAALPVRHSHSLTWVKGGRGRGLFLNDGKLVTWPVNKKGEPQHADMYEYLTNTKLPESHSVQDFVEGTPFDIYEDGQLTFFDEALPPELIADLSKIDYRLKTSNVKLTKEFTKEDALDLMDKYNFDFNTDEFIMGMNDELEHEDVTHGDPDMTAKIVADHLREHPDYYSRLHKTFSEKIAKHYLGFATHFHPYTGQECNCHYGQSNRGPILGRVASQAVRKVKNQDQKHLRSESGQAILDYLHKLISGHGIDERGEFGQGEYPGVEGMVPWVVKQLKTGWIKPFFNDDGSVANMGQLDSYYGTPEKVKETLSKRANLLIDVEGMSDLSGVQESYGKNGYKFVTGEIDNPNVKVIYINNYGEGNLDPATIQSIVESRPDIHVFVSEEDRGIADALRERYQSNPLVDISSSAVSQMRFIQDLIDKYPVNPPTDYSIEIPYTFYNNIPWNSWSDWFNATNAPAREGKDIMKMTPLEVTNSSRDHQEYLRELREQEELKKRFADTKDENVVYSIQDPKYKGWNVKQIASREDAELETEVLGHCIGSDEQNYAYNIQEGNIEAFSLRDEYGIPKLTWHYNPDGTLAHVQGKSNDSDEMFRPLVTEFNATTGRDDDDGGDGSEDQLEAEEEEDVWDEVQLPSVDNVEDFVYQYHEDGDGKWELANELASDEGATLSEDVQIMEGDPDWQTIVEDLFERYEVGRNDTDDFFSTIMQDGWLMNQFAIEADQYIKEWDPEEYDAGGELIDIHDEPAMFDYYRQWRGVHTNPQTGKLEEPTWMGGMSGGDMQESYEEKNQKELENPWSFHPSWSELKTITGDPAVNEENRLVRTPYLPASQNVRNRQVALEDGAQCPTCEGGGEVRMRSSDNEMMACPDCNGTGFTKQPLTVGPGRQRVLEEPSGQMYFGKLTAEQKARAWDKPASKLSKAEARYINGKL